MAQYRKKPVVIEAWQFSATPSAKPGWLAAAIDHGFAWYQGGDEPYMTIKTPDIFEKTYEAVAA